MPILVLASQSPRRKEILSKAGYEFVTRSVETPENLDQGLSLAEGMKQIALEKARAVIHRKDLLPDPSCLILSADTLVIFKGQTLGKPRSELEAQEFLERLSGETHQVYTAFCFLEAQTGKHWADVDESTVLFHRLTKEQIQNYVASGEPMDKAGAYGIQGLGGKFVKQVTGSFENVMGLPIQKIEKFIREMGWDLERRR